MNSEQIASAIEQMKQGRVYLTGGATSDTAWSIRFDVTRNAFVKSVNDEEWNTQYEDLDEYQVASTLKIFGDKIIKAQLMQG